MLSRNVTRHNLTLAYSSLDLTEVEKVRAELGDTQEKEDKGVVVVSASQYCR